jgi:hypothetical protein
MEVLGGAPDWARAGFGASAWPVPVRSPGPPGSAADRRSGLLGAWAEEPFECVVRLAAMVLDTPSASVTVAVKRFSSRRTCPGSTRAEAHREIRPRVGMAARNQALLDWLTDDQRFLTAVYAATLHEGFPARDGRPARVRGRLAGRRPVTADRADNIRSSAAGTARRPTQATMPCPRPTMVRVSGHNGPCWRRTGRSGRREVMIP